MKMADAKQKRNEQLKRWIGSETDLEPPVVKRKKTKVKFDDGAVFLAACSSGDTEEVLRLLERGADINYANVDGLTALHQVGAGPIEGPLAGLGRRGGEGRGRPSATSPSPPRRRRWRRKGPEEAALPPLGGVGVGRWRQGQPRTRWGPRAEPGAGWAAGAGGCTPSPRAGRRKGRMGLSSGGKEVPLTLFSFPLFRFLPRRAGGSRPCPVYVEGAGGRCPPAWEGDRR